MDRHVILVEDNEADADLFKYAFEKLGYKDKILELPHGLDAEDFLFDQNNALPDLIVLDINLPYKSGLDVLKKIKENERTKRIPVVIFTTSSLESDVSKAYENYANAYITKPSELDLYLDTIKRLHDFMLDLAVKVVK